MKARGGLVVALVMIAGSIAGTMVARRGDERSTQAIAASDAGRPRSAPAAPPTSVAEPPATDLVAWYDSVRDDANPVARVRAIEAWDRDARPDASVELLAHALVDPDPAVRERAQVLFDRRMARR